MELPPALRKMSKETFAHHVNAERNDFANWIEHVVDERKLAQDVRKLTSKTAVMKAVRERLR